jgi:hypothetical protein
LAEPGTHGCDSPELRVTAVSKTKVDLLIPMEDMEDHLGMFDSTLT